jgi:RimJ/RimL family protein N-acetyltransferase|tara:strand:- start:354 stop:845 length:492 start_codon:yes stop_codon:yes gene_type:complete
MKKKFIPTDYIIPEVLETDRFRLRMLTVKDVKLDYDAVMTSIEHLQKTKPFGPNHKWPTHDLSFEQDLIDLGWHQKEFQKKSSFAFTVMSLDETECLGCLYIYPSDNPNYDVIIIMWVRQSEIPNGLDKILFSNVKKWIQEKWPFKKVAYPGREVNWDKFEDD